MLMLDMARQSISLEKFEWYKNASNDKSLKGLLICNLIAKEWRIVCFFVCLSLYNNNNNALISSYPTAPLGF